ncbi:MAG TPA: polyprenyl diphosphate synthase [Spirochaetia bacterium]|nr:polyprenyl diphosphate synthase [Spirochaetales bacterium]HPD79537.1 polyprenyl diphosphate synthase [Spirochaetales bacterium]HQK33876.1 polyprenyl diphosphate synthase [Spirochaetales bacterium]HRS65715.1 polyprenyl diphosphate synthase [Spirochaetia bacterium]HRV27231.1 polyprenyl diphosphate synthase [Spirochaetia bacterium]
MDISNVPLHVGIIMDGNGRWAKARGLPRTEGHKEGLKIARRIVLDTLNLGIKFLSLYTFSTENWKRTQDEVGFLMNLIPGSLRNEIPFYNEHKIRVIHSGIRDNLPQAVKEALDEVSEITKSHTALTVNLAINYGGRNEIVRAVQKLINQNSKITEETIASALDHPDLPDPDLIIRTGGELRLSNFLLWQSAYTELYFSNKLWPDFSKEDYYNAIYDFSRRERRFGGNS